MLVLAHQHLQGARPPLMMAIPAPPMPPTRPGPGPGGGGGGLLMGMNPVQGPGHAAPLVLAAAAGGGGGGGGGSGGLGVRAPRASARTARDNWQATFGPQLRMQLEEYLWCVRATVLLCVVWWGVGAHGLRRMDATTPPPARPPAST